MLTEQKHIAKKEQVLYALEGVKDPEIPVLSVIDLGMITDVSVNDVDEITIKMIPTYSACPAIAVIKKSIKDKIESLNIGPVNVIVETDKRWTSNFVSAKGKQALEKFGISRPQTVTIEATVDHVEEAACPHCGSTNTTLNSVFGSTLCRSTHYCYDCKQLFEKFKPI
jgi:ring-1,2-phenylacetyl-CoA epoxidase subunit PaaD